MPWEMDFFRPIQDWELKSVSNFLDLLYSAPSSQNEEDQLGWIPSGTQIFQVKSFYNILARHINTNFPWKTM